jgi:DNA-binding response OmpR family regulator
MELSDTLCRSLSENTVIPVILLTVRDGAQDMVQGLSIGADDYVTKPLLRGCLHQ